MIVRKGTDNAQTLRRDRRKYPEVGAAMRQAVQRALADPELKFSEARVLLVVLADVASWSRLTEAAGINQLAARAGVSGKTVSRAMGRLSQTGVVIWRPTTRRGASLMGLPEVTDSGHPDVSTGSRRTGQSQVSAAPDHSGHVDVPLPEEITVNEKKTRERTSAIGALVRSKNPPSDMLDELIDLSSKIVGRGVSIDALESLYGTLPDKVSNRWVLIRSRHREVDKLGLSSGQQLWGWERKKFRLGQLTGGPNWAFDEDAARCGSGWSS